MSEIDNPQLYIIRDDLQPELLALSSPEVSIVHYFLDPKDVLVFTKELTKLLNNLLVKQTDKRFIDSEYAPSALLLQQLLESGTLTYGRKSIIVDSKTGAAGLFIMLCGAMVSCNVGSIQLFVNGIDCTEKGYAIVVNGSSTIEHFN